MRTWLGLTFVVVGWLVARPVVAAPYGDGLPARAVTTQTVRPAAAPGFQIVTTHATLDGLAIEPPAQALVSDGFVRFEAPRTVKRLVEHPSRLDAMAARRVVRAASAATAELQWRRFGTELRRVWQIAGRAAHWSVDAQTGEVLARVEHPSAPLASTYPRSPIVDDAPILVELSTLEDDAPALASADLLVDSCETPTSGQWPGFTGRCDLTERAVPDAEGNFVAEPELDVFAFDDAFAETSAFSHAERVLDTFAAHGVPTLLCPELADQPTHIVVNYWREGVEPYNNGNYLGACNPAIVIGQGSDADGAYDADLVAHELGHALVHTVSGHTLYEANAHPHGVTADPKAINEGFADFIAAVHVGDSELIFFGQDGRALEHDLRCPDDFYGQQHNDGRPFAGMLWDFYVEHGDAVVAAVIDTLAMLEPDAGFDDAAGVLRAVVAAELGPEAAAWLDDALLARGLEGCDRIVPHADEQLVLIAPLYGFANFIPGPLQIRIDPPPNAVSATLVTAGIAQQGGLAPISVLTRSGEPVRFEYSDDAPISVTAHFDTAHEGLEFPDTAIEVPVEGGVPLYVAFAQTGDAWIYGGVVSVEFEVEESGADETGEADASTEDSGGGEGSTTGGDDTGDAGDTSAVGHDGRAPAGCSCRLDGGDRTWLALPFVILIVRRRWAGHERAPVRRCRPRWGHRRIAGHG